MKIGISLSSGSAKGWIHAGIIRELTKNDIVPEVVAGCSSGAVIGAAYADGSLDEMVNWGLSIKPGGALSYFDLNPHKGGILSTKNLFSKISEIIKVNYIEELKIKTGIVSTDIHTGEEIWLTSGDLNNALRCSAAIPGIFAPIKNHNRWMVDGAIVNPTPVSLCKKLGADFVISSDLLNNEFDNPEPIEIRSSSSSYDLIEVHSLGLKEAYSNNKLLKYIKNKIYSKSLEKISFIRKYMHSTKNFDMNLINVAVNSLEILETNYKKHLAKKNQADFTLNPEVKNINIFDFHKAESLVKTGEEVVKKNIKQIKQKIAEMS